LGSFKASWQNRHSADMGRLDSTSKVTIPHMRQCVSKIGRLTRTLAAGAKTHEGSRISSCVLPKLGTPTSYTDRCKALPVWPKSSTSYLSKKL
jgi:hypothetical protein